MFMLIVTAIAAVVAVADSATIKAKHYQIMVIKIALVLDPLNPLWLE